MISYPAVKRDNKDKTFGTDESKPNPQLKVMRVQNKTKQTIEVVERRRLHTS